MISVQQVYTISECIISHDELDSFDDGIITFIEKFQARFPEAKVQEAEWCQESWYVLFRREAR